MSFTRGQLAAYAEAVLWLRAATSSGDPVRAYIEARTDRFDDRDRMHVPVPVPDPVCRRTEST